MSFLSDFQMELISQTSIVNYIEFQFERELDVVSKFVDIKIPQKLYDDNIKFMERLTTDCNAAIERIQQSYRPEKTMPEIAKDIDMREPIGEVIDYCVEKLEEEDSLNLDVLKRDIAEANSVCGEMRYNFKDEEIQEIIGAAQIIFNNNRNNELYEKEVSIDTLKTSINLVNNASTSNIFRQSFINIFSIFDAYVFDYVKKYFYLHPEKIDGFFDTRNTDKVRVALNDVTTFTNIEDLKTDMVKKYFVGRYLSEIINKLRNYNKNIFNNITYAELMEMIERRNIHLHNKGYTDEKYCDRFNIYSFNIGDYAYIDKNYLFIKVFNTLSAFSTNLEKELPLK